jgi:hypothetical protein
MNLYLHTDCDWLDLDTLLYVCGGWIIGIFVIKDTLAAECVDEGCSACEKGQLRCDDRWT